MASSGKETDRATDEAARWLVALEDEPDDPDLRARFDAWLRADPANATAWADTADIYDMVGRTEPAHRPHWAPFAAERNQPSSETRAASRRFRGPTPRPRRRPRNILTTAATTAAAACLLVVLAPSIALRLTADYVTATAEQRSVRLADGSEVRLGPDSAIDVTFSSDARRVRLLKGEGYFKVVHDAARPFRVEAHGVETTDLGTAFDVRLADGRTDVAVEEGRVQVVDVSARPPVAEQLSRGQWAQVAWTGATLQGTVAPDAVAAWRSGQIVAQDRPMGDVVDELRAYYGGLIVFTDGAFAREHITGVYNTADPVAALRAVAGVHGGAVHRVSPWLVVISGG